MTVVAGSLDSRDVALLARMHLESLPGSLVSRIGEAYARAFYRYIARSSRELVLVERGHDGALVAACVVSLEPASLSKRLLVRTPLALFAPLALARLPWRALAGGASGPPQPDGAEILLVFTVAEGRSRGVGGKLVARCERLLRARGVSRLLVKTRDDPDNRAIGFYARAGFDELGRVETMGKRLVMFGKALG